MQLFKRCLSVALAAALPLFTTNFALAADQSDDDWMEDDPPVAERTIEPPAEATSSPVLASTSSTGTPLLKGQVTYCVPSGTPIKLKLATVPTFGMKMMNRDLDGKLYPAQLNETITAKTTEDIYVDNNKVIPQGTVFHGRVSKVFPPKRAGRPGSLALSFDAFETPDGRKFAFRAEANNTRQSTGKSKLRGTLRTASYAAGGAVTGALLAYEFCGLEKTIAMHGYNIAGGAAVGLLFGTAVALLSHGPQAVLEPGDDLNMEIDTDLLIPAAISPNAKAPPLNLPGLEVIVLKTKVLKDGLDSYQLKLEADIANNTNRRLQSIDLFVEDDNGTRFPVVADIEEDKSDMLFTVDPYTQRHVICDFSYEFPKLKRKLVWLDHQSRQVLFEQRLP